MSKPKGAKQPQDHQKKGVDRLQAEASKIPGIAETENRQLVIASEGGPITVTTRPMLKWKGSVVSRLREGDFLEAICGMVSPEDAARLRMADPELEELMTAVYADDEESGEASPGESQAS